MISANLGGYDVPNEWPEQTVPVDVCRYTDANFPPRPLAMTSRLQCGIPKWFGFDLRPGYDVYIWIDGSCAPTPTCAAWFLEQLGDGDIAVFAHPERKTVREEYEFMRARMARPGETYLTSRYGGEWLDEAFARCDPNARLVASTAFAYRPSQCVRDALELVWLAKTRWLLHDQMALSDLLACLGGVRYIPDNYLKCSALTFTRTGARRSR